MRTLNKVKIERLPEVRNKLQFIFTDLVQRSAILSTINAS